MDSEQNGYSTELTSILKAIDEQKQYAEIAPIYDCGSCLYPQMNVNDMAKVLSDENEINQRIYTFPTSVILEKVNEIIANMPIISDLQKDFYQTMITERKEKILDYSMGLLMNQNQGNALTHGQGLSSC